MIRNFKALGLALIAIFAMSAAVTSAAASADTFHSESSLTTLTGAQETGTGKNKFNVGGQAVECNTATYHATVSGTAVSQITGITPTYGTCNYGANPATVTVPAGCTYTLTGTTDVNEDAESKVVCGASHITIKIPAIKCEITVIKEGNASQTATKGVHYTNIGAGATAEVTIDLTAKVRVTSEEEPGSGGSAACTTLSGFPTGELVGSILIRGEEDGTSTQKGISVSNP